MQTAQSRNLKQAFKATQRESKARTEQCPFNISFCWNKNGNILNFSIRLNTRIPIAYWVSHLPINMKGRLLMWQCPDRSSCAYLLFLHFQRNTQKPKGIQVSSQRQFLFPSSSELPAFYLSFLVLVTPMKSVSNTRQGDRQGGWGWREEYMGERKNFRREIVFWNPQCVKNSNPLCEVIPDICLHF